LSQMKVREPVAARLFFGHQTLAGNHLPPDVI
jgi:hypothetical protein